MKIILLAYLLRVRGRTDCTDEVSGSTDCCTAALITKFKTPEMEKPVIRPYTPVSDEGTCIHTS